jgi:hypothetical protein
MFFLNLRFTNLITYSRKINYGEYGQLNKIVILFNLVKMILYLNEYEI